MSATAGEPRFTDQVWRQTAGIRAAIDQLPFVRQLQDGTLSADRFGYYLAQDALYLGDFGRALAAAASQSTTAEDLVFWSGAARTTILVERDLHATHIADLAAAEPSPTCTGYRSYLLSLATCGDYPVLAAGLLPCFWIYQDVGDRMLANAGDLSTHRYGDWIAAYGDPEFAQATQMAKELVDRLAEQAAAPTRRRMSTAFVTASRFEWLFWDAAYRMETWPV